MSKTFNESNDSLVFELIQEALGEEIELVDRALISREESYEDFTLAVPRDLVIIKDLRFFQLRQYEYRFVQLGEFLTFKNLETDKPFVAYTREAVGYCPLSEKPIHEIVAYKPE